MNRQLFSSVSLILSTLLAITFAAVNLPAQTGVCSDCTELGKIAAQVQREADDAAFFLSDLPEQQQKVSNLRNERDRARNFRYAAENHKWAYTRQGDQARDTFNKYQDAADNERAQKNYADANAAEREEEAFAKRVSDLGKEIDDLQAKIQSAKANADKLAKDAEKAWKAYYDCVSRSKCPPANRTATGSVPAAVPLPHDGASSIKITISNSCSKAEQYGFSSGDLPAGLFEPPDAVMIDTEATREVTLTFNAKTSGPGLYFGNITVKCLTCDQECPRPAKTLPVVVYAPAQ